MNRERALYLCTALFKRSQGFSYTQKWTIERMKSSTIVLPRTANKDIAFRYMERYVRRLEAERVRRLEAYLKISGLDDTNLTEKESHAIKKLRDGKIKWANYKIGDWFEQLKTKYLGKGKRQQNVSRIKTAEYTLPVICAKRGENGIMYWGREADFTSYSNVLSVIYNGAVAAGLVYAQKEPVGIYTDSYLIQLKNQTVAFETNLFLKTILEKAIYLTHSRDNKAVWNRVKQEKVWLPLNEKNEPDWAFMETLIRAESRLVISGITAWKDKHIQKTKELIDG